MAQSSCAAVLCDIVGTCIANDITAPNKSTITRLTDGLNFFHVLSVAAKRLARWKVFRHGYLS